ncbi:unnamed protein product (mitochondrion) [Plasmodiophora brassicae]|uniref:Aldehyde dehydrogenase domain-containing protein n=1 Tax=Plasmodiophora brassicae TaxID=37360 RepID=A0A0G4J783_PLABS|nr:hypothetical protein PBRA_003210 [Plasmodiophora brassicae]SPQ95681.1 unnamed protein product [Plasmodiophora brassicae]
MAIFEGAGEARDKRETVTVPPEKLAYRGRQYTVPVGLFINNEFVQSVSGKKFPTVNPATEEPILEFYEGDASDVDIAVSAASAAFAEWSKVAPATRGLLLAKLADRIEANAEELAELESLGNGKPKSVALQADLPLTVATFRYYAGWSDKIVGKVVDTSPDFHTYTRHEPIGVVGQIIPWNFPLLMLAWKIAPALACGNTIVLKTSEKTPMTALKIAELIVDVGFAPGVVNIISGYGPTAGHAIATHKDIHKVAFTGSTASGKKVAVAAAESNMKKVTMELGGKSPNIIFPDADLDQACQSAFMGIFFNCGQCCCAGSRVFVHEKIYDAFIAKFKALMDRSCVGDPFDSDTTVGPIVDKLQFDRVSNYIKAGIAEGASVEHTASKPRKRRGYFIAPTLFTNVKDEMGIAQEEIFGPVVCVLKFSRADEVIKRANATTYGLAAAVHTKDLQTAIKMTNELQAGTVWVNCYNVFNTAMPFGGYKQSGVGRELGEYALSEYTQVKSVVMKVA